MTEFVLTLPEAITETIAHRIATIVRSEIDATTTATPYMTVAEAAEYLRCDPQRVYDLASSGRLPRYKESRRTLHLRSDVVGLIEREHRRRPVAPLLPHANGHA